MIKDCPIRIQHTSEERRVRGRVCSAAIAYSDETLHATVPAEDGSPGTHAASLRQRAFCDGALVTAVLFGLLLRLRIHGYSPLASEQPIIWMLWGLSQDVFLLGAAAGVIVLFARRLARLVLGLLVLLLFLLHAVWAEVLIFFGQSPRFDALAAGINPTFLAGSAQGNVLVSLGLATLTLLFFLRASAWWADRAKRAWSTPLRLLLLSAAAGLLLLFPFRPHRVDLARNPIPALMKAWRTRPVGVSEQAAAPLPAPRRALLSVRNLAPATPPRRYLSESYPLAHAPPARFASAPSVAPGVSPNLVFLLLEGVRAEEIGAYGGKPAGLTPNLDRLAREGVRVEEAYSPGMHTPDAELAVWYGLLPNPSASLMTNHPGTRLTGLPEVLRASGWKSFLWIHNGDQTFYRRDRFYLPRGFRMIDGRDFPRSDPRTNWGYSDRSLSRHAIAALDRAAPPFAALVLTVSNHHPFQVPEDGGPRFPGLPPEKRGFLPFPGSSRDVGLHTVPMLRTIHYTDEAVGDFFRLAQTRPWFENTLFVVLGDHGLAIAPLEGRLTPHRLDQLVHRVPLILFSPLLPKGQVVTGLASQIDLLPTILGFFGIVSPRPGLGRDLLDPFPSAENRTVVTWNAEARAVTVFAQGRVYRAEVPEEASAAGVPPRFREETLVDAASDPSGLRNRIADEPEIAAALRRQAEIYLEVYPFLLLSGRSGIPDGLPPKERDRRAKSVTTPKIPRSR